MKIIRKGLNYINNKSIKTLTANAMSMAFSKGIDMFTQLLIMPQLIAVYGISIYGNISFYVVIMQYLTMFCDFGFNFNATKRVADMENVSHIFTAVFISKTILMIVINVGLLICYITITSFPLLLYISLSLFVLLTSYNVDWLFLGKQKMGLPVILKFVAKTTYIFIIIRYINYETNYEYVIILDCCIPIINVVALLYAIYRYKIKLVKISQEYLYRIINESWILFSSSLFIGFYRNINIIVLKWVAGEYYVGIYAAVEKLSRACQSIIEPMTTALFPFVAKQSNGDVFKKKHIIKTIGRFYILMLSVLVILLICYSDVIISLFNIDGASARLNFYIMLASFFFGSMNYLLGYVGLVNLNKSSCFRHATICIGVVSIPLTFVLSYVFQNVGAALSVALSECWLCYLLLNYLSNKKYA